MSTAKLVVGAGIGLATLALALPAIAQQGGRREDRCKLAVGDPAPDFTLKDAKGENETQLSKLAGKPVVLVFGSYT